jgi:hypothetical protein
MQHTHLPPAPPPTPARVHCLIGDYHAGLKAMYPLNLFERASLYTPKIPLCNITLYYYASFCYVMMRRWAAAAGGQHAWCGMHVVVASLAAAAGSSSSSSSSSSTWARSS